MKKDDKPFVEVFADGACSGNPGVGGYGVILRSGGRQKELSGCELLTTNNRMELTAVVRGLEALKRPCKVKVVTDSNYIVQGMSVWIYAWLRNNWKNSQKQEVANRDLWEQLWDICRNHEVSWEWIKGHNAHTENERCDAIAKGAIKKCKGT